MAGPDSPTGATRLAAVIGDPVRHSLSPVLYNAAFAALDLDWVYVALPVDTGRGADVVEAMRTLGLDGLSVTTPHKQAVAEAVDDLTPAAAALGAVNCVQRVDDRLIGHNTDGEGLRRSAEVQLGFDPAGANVAVLGAGGAAVAAASALVAAGSQVDIVNRTAARAEAAAAASGASVGGPDATVTADLVVQATSLGMQDGDALPIDPSLLAPHQLLVELIYHPAETPLLAEARALGLSAINGVGMLLYQAGAQFRLWTGHAAPIEVMASAVGLEL